MGFRCHVIFPRLHKWLTFVFYFSLLVTLSAMCPFASSFALWDQTLQCGAMVSPCCLLFRVPPYLQFCIALRHFKVDCVLKIDETIYKQAKSMWADTFEFYKESAWSLDFRYLQCSVLSLVECKIPRLLIGVSFLTDDTFPGISNKDKINLKIYERSRSSSF